MNTATLAYIAAIYDAKGKALVTRGTVRGASLHGKPLQAKSYRITLAYNDKEILNGILDELRSSKDSLSWIRQARIGCRHGYYRLEIFGEQAYILMNAILPYIKKADKRQSLLDVLDDSWQPSVDYQPQQAKPVKQQERKTFIRGEDDDSGSYETLSESAAKKAREEADWFAAEIRRAALAEAKQ